MLVAIIVGVMAHAPRSALFATPLHADQVGEVEAQLAQWRVPFTPRADNVIVESRRRSELLLRLSLAGVPHAHVATTSEALANLGVLTPQSVIDAQTRTGLAGDIEMGLRSIDGVEDARVIVAPAHTAEFADQHASDATASVRLHLRAGVHLTRAQIEGIRAFVAASVPQLDAARVTIVDDRGVALGAGEDDGDDGATRERELQSALDAALGPGMAIVRVHEARTQAATEHRETLRAPVAGAVTRSLDTESYDDGAKRYRKSDERDDRGAETRETVARTAAGALVRVSTAVFLDASRAGDLVRVRDLAAATVGYDPRRGDQLSVEAVEFHRALRARSDPWMLAYGILTALLPFVALAVAAIALTKAALPALVGLVRAHAESVAVERATRTVAGYAPAQVRGVLAHEPPHAAAAIISALPAATAAAVLELYPAHEREAIVRRMQRAHAPIVPDLDEVLRTHA